MNVRINNEDDVHKVWELIHKWEKAKQCSFHFENDIIKVYVGERPPLKELLENIRTWPNYLWEPAKTTVLIGTRQVSAWMNEEKKFLTLRDKIEFETQMDAMLAVIDWIEKYKPDQEDNILDDEPYNYWANKIK